MVPFADPNVQAAFAAFPELQRANLLALRELIFDVAQSSNETGVLDETLKWGQPAYLTKQPKSGTTIRLGLTKSNDCALFTHCQTTVVADFQALFPDAFKYQGNRALVIQGLSEQEPLIRKFISSALTYHAQN